MIILKKLVLNINFLNLIKNINYIFFIENFIFNKSKFIDKLVIKLRSFIIIYKKNFITYKTIKIS